jgi:DNA-binding beta-propeller fold protein YncE
MDTWGVKGAQPGQLQDPSAIATDAVGDVYVTNAGNAYVNKFGATGTPLLSLQEDGLNHPEAVTVDDGGAFYVGDPVRDSVFIFVPEGDKHRELRLRTKSSDENRLSIAVGDDGLIHVLDSNAGKVFTFTPRGKLVQTWLPSAGGTTYSRYGPINRANDGFLYVGTSGGTILKFTREGQRVAEIHPSATGVRWDAESGFALWSNHIFVMDPDGRTLHVATLDGATTVDADLTPQLGPSRHNPPMLAIGQQGELLLLDPLDCRILRYRIRL